MRESLDWNHERQKVVIPEMVRSETSYSNPPQKLLDEEALQGLCDYDQPEPGEL